ncbi:MAG: hypothetical protein J5762_05855 [Clostridia bacterium]|nr:hypothetical protein [Clostridia bacterium]
MINYYDSYLVLSKVYSEGAFIKQAINDTPLEQLSLSRTVKICYGVLDNDLRLDYYIAKLCEKSPKLKIKIILKIGMYAIEFLGNKPFAVTDALVELTKKLGKSANAGFVNAFLRRFAEKKVELPENEKDYLSVKYSFPVFAVEELINDYGDKAESIMAFNEEYTFLRFNNGIDGEKYLSDNGLAYEKTPFYNVFSVPNKKMDADFDKGIYTFQSVGSAAICSLVGKGRDLLDACAAPGGKTVFLADKFDKVTALELHSHRAKLIESYVKRMKKTNVDILLKDAGEYDKSLGKFSAVLCDVPCSGYGTIKTNPDIKLNRSANSIAEINKEQLRILSTCSEYVELGGKLVYSTCSVFDAENDVIVGKFLENNDDFEVFYETCELPHLSKKYGLQFLPDISMGAGFYVSLMRRIK